MALEREQVAELVLKIFDRLEGQFSRAEVVDAVVVVELSDPDDMVELDDQTGRMVPATLVLLESTTNRVTVQSGILDFAMRTIVGVESDET